MSKSAKQNPVMVASMSRLATICNTVVLRNVFFRLRRVNMVF